MRRKLNRIKACKSRQFAPTAPTAGVRQGRELTTDSVVVGPHEKSAIDKLLSGGNVGDKLKKKRTGYNIWVVD